MLHGCTQDPDDFAAGTNMNEIAGRHGLLVAYPAQSKADNASACWNWFRPGDQHRDLGEPAIIAGLTRTLMSEFDIDPARIFIAGFSAGGAMAAVLSETYPELYAAVGVHSGLAYRSAHDVVSAFSAMRGDTVGAAFSGRGAQSPSPLPTIVFQGRTDNTVHPANAARIIKAGPQEPERERGRSERGRDYERTVWRAADGAPAAELWLIDGAGHAWSGGRASGSYTDPAGPDASTEMVRFFLNAS
jgi:poly(hydroxyalkanoate) depolymerase family esterase